VITSISSIAKELVENSLDAKATVISVKLENYGFDRLEVKDNGCGIGEDDVGYIAKPHFTSKIESFEDLNNLSTYGFRGEALSSLCAVSDVFVSTKNEKDNFGFTYSFDCNGNILDKKPAAVTTVCIVTRSVIFQKPSSHDFSSGIHCVFRESSKYLIQKERFCDDVRLKVYLPRQKENTCSLSSSDKLFIFVNERPISHKAIEKLIKAYYSHKTEGAHGRYPTGVVMLNVPSTSIDVNLEPNKTRVYFNDEKLVLDQIEKILSELYGPILSSLDGKKVSLDDAEECVPCTLATTQGNEEIDSDPWVERASLKTTAVKEIDKPVNTAFSNENDKPQTFLIHKSKEFDNSNKNLIDNTSIFTRNTVENNEQVNSSSLLTSTVENNDPFAQSHNKPVLPLEKPINHKCLSLGINTKIEKLNTKEPSPLKRPRDINSSLIESNNKIDDTYHKDDDSLLPSKGLNNNENLKSRQDIIEEQSPWSMGRLLKNDKNIQSVEILQPAQVINKRENECDIKRKNTDLLELDSPHGMKKFKINIRKSTSSPFLHEITPTKTESAFSLFAKSLRKQGKLIIIEENPGACFTVIAQELSNKWKNADPETKCKFEEMAKEYKSDKNLSLRASPTLSLQKISKNIFQNTENLCFRNAKPTKTFETTKLQPIQKAKPWQNRSKAIQFVFENLKRKMQRKSLLKLPSESVIGSLKGVNGWIYRIKNSICAFNTSRMNEIILFKSLVGSFSIPVVKLEEPLVLNANNLGVDNWQMLISLDCKESTFTRECVSIDARINSNGFKISLFKKRTIKSMKKNH
ncbi:PMS1-like protein 1, partial [Armadillidium nasatum]